MKSSYLIKFDLIKVWCHVILQNASQILRFKDAPDGDFQWASNLCVCTGVPVWIIDDDSVGSSQIDSQTSNFSGQQENEDGSVL